MILNIILTVIANIAVDKSFNSDLERELSKRRCVIANDDEIGVVFSHRTLSGRYLIRYIDSERSDIGFDLNFDFENHDDAVKYYNDFLRVEREVA